MSTGLLEKSMVMIKFGITLFGSEEKKKGTYLITNF